MAIRNGHARWAFDLAAWRPTHADLMLATACIQPEEKERLAKFVYRGDFDASLVGRLLARKFVHNASGLAYDQIRIDRDAGGRPYVPPAPDRNDRLRFDFNISHQGRFSVLAGCVASSRDAEKTPSPSAALLRIGVDAMKMEYTGGKSLSEFFRIMDRNFTANEWRYIKGGLSERDKIRAFMRTWCLKESYTKNTGIGITADLRSIDFTVRTAPLDRTTPATDTIVHVSGALGADWRFEESLLDAEHCVCVALHGHDAAADAIPFETIGFDELMAGAKPLLAKDADYCTTVMGREYKTC